MRLCSEIEKYPCLGMDFGATPFYNSYGIGTIAGFPRHCRPPGAGIRQPSTSERIFN